MPDSFAKYEEARIFFLLKKIVLLKQNFFCVFPNSAE